MELVIHRKNMLVRPIEERDRPILEQSIAKDQWHSKTTKPEFFFDAKAISTVFDGETGPIMFVKGSTVLRLDIQFCDNEDRKNNALALNELAQIIETAKASGFSELVFCTDSPLLKAYCVKHFQFEEIRGAELVRYL
jgi:hypothetical protein